MRSPVRIWVAAPKRREVHLDCSSFLFLGCYHRTRTGSAENSAQKRHFARLVHPSRLPIGSPPRWNTVRNTRRAASIRGAPSRPFGLLGFLFCDFRAIYFLPIIPLTSRRRARAFVAEAVRIYSLSSIGERFRRLTRVSPSFATAI